MVSSYLLVVDMGMRMAMIMSMSMAVTVMMVVPASRPHSKEVDSEPDTGDEEELPSLHFRRVNTERMS